MKLYVHPEDQAAFINAMNRQFLTEALDRTRVFEMTYRRIKNSASFYVRMKVSRMEDDNRYIVIGVTNIDDQMRQRHEEERMKEERTTYERIHALTGNFIAIYVVDPVTDRYREFGSADGYDALFGQSKEGERFFDTARQAGDQYLRDACKTICDAFKRSPVFRVGGDEFAVICQGSDYECVDAMLAKMRDHNGMASRTGGITIACGMARFEADECVASVFERADSSMYENKKALKTARHDTDA